VGAAPGYAQPGARPTGRDTRERRARPGTLHGPPRAAEQGGKQHTSPWAPGLGFGGKRPQPSSALNDGQ